MPGHGALSLAEAGKKIAVSNQTRPENESGGRLRQLPRISRDGLRAGIDFYSRSGKEEKWLVKASFYIGVTSAVLWYVLILYWGALDFSSEEIGYIEAIGTAAGLVTYLVGGYLADKLGRRLLFLVGLVATAIGLVIFFGERSFAPFVVAYTFTNIGGSLAWPCLTALMADKTSPADMKYFFSVQGFVNQLGTTAATFFGIFVPAYLRDSYGTELATGYGYVFLVTVICSFVPIIYILRVTEKPAMTEKLIVHYDRRMQKMLAVYAVQNAMFGVGAAFVITWFPLIFEKGMHASLYDVSLMIALSNVVLAVGWLVVAKFAEIRGSVVLISVAQIASVVPFLMIPYVDSLIIVAILYTIRNFLMIVPVPVLNAYLVNVVSREIRASFLSLSQLAWMVGFAPSAALAGHFWNNEYSKAEPFFIASLMYIVATLIFWGYFRNVADPGDAKRNGQSK